MKNFPALLARVMVTGTLGAAGIIAVGLVWFLCAHAGESPGDHIFSGEPKYFTDPIGMVQRALEWNEIGHRRGLIMIGIVLLLLGPPVRVALAGLGYFLERDRLYAAISGVVFLVLVFSFFW